MYCTYIAYQIFTRMNGNGIVHTSFIREVSYPYLTMITHRESYVFDTECKFCAHESERLVSEVNTKICPDCYSWASDSVGLSNLGIRRASE
jgi:hypothetical protein